MLEKEYQFFKSKRKEFLKDHKYEVVAIAEDKVLGFFSDFSSAYQQVIKSYSPGSFILQEILPDDEDVIILQRAVL